MIKLAILTGFVLLLLASSPSMAQVVATTDTRGQPATAPSVQITGGTGRGSTVGAKSLQVTFAVLDPGRLALGGAFDYEFVVTNRSDKNILLPQSLRWSDVEDAGEQEQPYQELEVSFALIEDKGNRASIQGDLFLYGKEADPTTMVALAPGDAVRILGTAKLAPVWIHTPVAFRQHSYASLPGREHGTLAACQK